MPWEYATHTGSNPVAPKNVKIVEDIKMIEPVLIDDETVYIFIDNLKKRKFMICFVYYDFGRQKKTGDLCIDIAKTNYYYEKEGSFSIGCRGTGYLDHTDLEYGNIIEVIKSSIHSFIECEKPEVVKK